MAPPTPPPVPTFDPRLLPDPGDRIGYLLTEYLECRAERAGLRAAYAAAQDRADWGARHDLLPKLAATSVVQVEIRADLRRLGVDTGQFLQWAEEGDR